MDIRQLLQLKKQAWSNRRIADFLSVHRNSVNAYVRQFEATQMSWSELLSLDDKSLSDLFISTGTTKKDRYDRLAQQFGQLRKELKKRGCTKQKLWENYCQSDPDPYGYTQFCVHLNAYLHTVHPSGKLQHHAGEKLYIDYCGAKLHYIDKTTGEAIAVEVYVAMLPASHYTYVEASASQQLPDFVASTNRCLSFFGGVPQCLVTDNLKSAVSKASRYEAVNNKTFRDLALHYGTVLNPTRPYAPQDKALVESTVKLVYQRIYYPLNKQTFFSLAELNQAITEKTVEFNDFLMSRLQVSRRQQFVQFEQSALQPLPPQPYTIRKYRRATVQKMGYVYLSEDRNYYSVPYRYIGKRVEVSYDEQCVSIHFKHERIAQHRRSHRPGDYVTIADHLSSTHQFYQQWSPDYFAKLAQPHGEVVVQYVQQLIASKSYPEVAYRQCLGIFKLSNQFSKKRLQRACQIGLTLSRYGYHIIRKILENKMDQVDAPPPSCTTDIDPHHNIRGADYYQ